MADLPISGLPASAGSTVLDPFPTVQGGVTKKILWSQMLDNVTDATIVNSTIDNTVIATSTIDSSPIGNNSPDTAIFSELSYPKTGSIISASTSISTSGTLSKTFDVDGSAVVITLNAIAGYQTGYFVSFVNISSSHSFVLQTTAPDLINGQSSITIQPFGAITVVKNYDGTSWGILSDNITQSGEYLQIANNLSDVADTLTSVNNLQLPNGIKIITSAIDVVLVNTGGDNISTYNISAFMNITNTKPGFSPISVILPLMDDFTPGQKSMAVGQSIRINNQSDGYDSGPHTIFIKTHDGSTIGTILAGSDSILTLLDNSSGNGVFDVRRVGPASSYFVSDLDLTTYFYVPTLTNTSKKVGNLPVYSTTKGSMGEASLTNGQLFIGSTSLAAVPATLTAGLGIGITNGPGSITITANGTNPWVEVTGTSQAMAAETSYIANNASLVTLTLPATAAIGAEFTIAGKGAGLFRIAQNAGQIIHTPTSNTTTGVGGSITSTNRYAAIRCACITENTEWTVISSSGTAFTIV